MLNAECRYVKQSFLINYAFNMKGKSIKYFIIHTHINQTKGVLIIV